MKSSVDAYLEQNPRWKPVIAALREILLEQDLAENITGGQLSYTYQDRSVASIESGHDYLSLLFTKGVLLKDPQSLLQLPGNDSVINRRLIFKTPEEVVELADALVDFFHQAIDHEKDTLKATSRPDS